MNGYSHTPLPDRLLLVKGCVAEVKAWLARCRVPDRQVEYYALAGLMTRAPTKMATATIPVTTASQAPAAARAAVAAHVVEVKASAKVAIREEVWRRRKW